ncbi:putative hydrolase of the HAD superfamily [Oikeobacillus pervagus]|uniref:Phosphoserine phosphatase n=1 Tax=Oikeobacillus pervagus TaxID=1325931 RepID=A0AAJ1T6I1_9BACI|nr:HAD-IA family hydrolase [Oikeobacillus pervagus]MDQ0216081.1 putative hydrolase of the HAD superfamily [Oikeobacillus pervagus]
MKKAIFFDLDDTLLNDRKSIQTAFDVTCGELADTFQVDAKEIEESVRTKAREVYSTFPFYSFTQQIGINPFEGLWGNFGDLHHFRFREMGENISKYQSEAWKQGLEPFGIKEEAAIQAMDRFKEVRRSSPFVYEETFEVLNTLKDHGYRLLLLTNGAPSLQMEKLAMTPELPPYFEHIIISGNIGFGKPNPILFDHALRIMDVSADEAIMVGDNLSTDILGSNRVKMESIWIDHLDGKVVKEAKPTYRVERLKDILNLLSI